MDPFVPALAVMVNVLRVKVAVTGVLLLMVTEQVREVPVHPPDHPAKVEPASGAAVRVTTVPVLKIVPTGLLVTVPVPVPLLLVLNVYWDEPD
jgi:hypothetical protein